MKLLIEFLIIFFTALILILTVNLFGLVVNGELYSVEIFVHSMIVSMLAILAYRVNIRIIAKRRRNNNADK